MSMKLVNLFFFQKRSFSSKRTLLMAHLSLLLTSKLFFYSRAWTFELRRGSFSSARQYIFQFKRPRAKVAFL